MGTIPLEGSLADRKVWGFLLSNKQSLPGNMNIRKDCLFGGNGPSKRQDLLRDRLGQLLRGTRRVVHFDLHTGLGKMGESKLLIDYLLTESQRKRLIDWFGKDSFCNIRKYGRRLSGSRWIWTMGGELILCTRLSVCVH